MKSKQTLRRWMACVLAASAAVFAQCYPSPDLSIEEYDTVVTVVAEDADFKGLQTYAMPDTVLQRPDEGGASRAFDGLILADIARNMLQMGYDRVFDLESADLVVVASVITEEQWRAYINWPWGGWYKPGGVFSYPPVGFQYLYTLGTVTIDMAVSKDLDPDAKEIPIVWTASVAGPLQSDKSNTASRITNGIDQAFAQSPYLKTK